MALQKREKILLGVMGAAVGLFLLNQFVFSKKPSPAVAKPAALVKKAAVVKRINPLVHPVSAVKSGPKKFLKRFKGWKRDPFVGAFTAEILDSLGYQKEQPYLLKAISWKNGQAYVLINDDIVKVGENVNGLKVLRIDGNRVICEKNLRKFSLILGGNEDEKKQDNSNNSNP
ncbi:hypothetical protein BMS3Abin05_02203 [bacterium BMS3Abin05]|nr:hypothetical protein BMS3Abin05_02203 [bacterium BMS3Abin05]GBE26689.1 hypothetical protein BMS3Bbin03_00608 [bacterium BMS3Bbin03]HDL79039.1 hypothetical protein [Bacteroidota bacterium]HDZ13215.1 hypothetical protein [Bacteroidota bacterium]